MCPIINSSGVDQIAITTTGKKVKSKKDRRHVCRSIKDISARASNEHFLLLNHDNFSWNEVHESDSPEIYRIWKLYPWENPFVVWLLFQLLTDSNYSFSGDDCVILQHSRAGCVWYNLNSRKIFFDFFLHRKWINSNLIKTSINRP